MEVWEAQHLAIPSIHCSRYEMSHLQELENRLTMTHTNHTPDIEE